MPEWVNWFDGPVVAMLFLVERWLSHRPIRVRPGEQVVVKDGRGNPSFFHNPAIQPGKGDAIGE